MNIGMNRSLARRVTATLLLAVGIWLASMTQAAPAIAAGWGSAGQEDTLEQCESDGQMGVYYGEWLDWYCRPIPHGYVLMVLYP
jgi:hypothetical protein